MTNKLYPKCHPYWEEDGEKIKNPQVKGVAYTAEGYLLPCCWCDRDQPKIRKEFEFLGFYEEDLKVSNVDDIKEEILKSPEWYTFHKMLLEEPNNAPEICKRKCIEPQFRHTDFKDA